MQPARHNRNGPTDYAGGGCREMHVFQDVAQIRNVTSRPAGRAPEIKGAMEEHLN
jgi:hypothetical protein